MLFTWCAGEIVDRPDQALALAVSPVGIAGPPVVHVGGEVVARRRIVEPFIGQQVFWLVGPPFDPVWAILELQVITGR